MKDQIPPSAKMAVKMFNKGEEISYEETTREDLLNEIETLKKNSSYKFSLVYCLDGSITGFVDIFPSGKVKIEAKIIK